MFDINTIKNGDAYYKLKHYQLELWQYLLGQQVDIGERFCNPFRQDKNPGAHLKWYNSMLLFQDYGASEFHNLSVFQMCQKINNCTFKEALQILEYKSNIPAIKNHDDKIIKSFFQPVLKFEPKKRNNKIWFSNEDINVWKPFDISPDILVRDKVFPVHAYMHNTKNNPDKLFTRIPPDPTFSLCFPSKHKKIYRPTVEDKALKWLTDCDINDIGFIDHIIKGSPKKVLLLTKSYKDARILKNLGYDAVWVQSETTPLPEKIILYLASKYEKIFLLYDNDKEGIRSSIKISDMCNKVTQSEKFFPVWYPTNLPKDTAEIYADLGKDRVKTELINLI